MTPHTTAKIRGRCTVSNGDDWYWSLALYRYDGVIEVRGENRESAVGVMARLLYAARQAKPPLTHPYGE